MQLRIHKGDVYNIFGVLIYAVTTDKHVSQISHKFKTLIYKLSQDKSFDRITM